MTTERFWVVGGDYSCLAFKTFKSGAPQVLGPFEDRAEATTVWRRVSEANRSKATARYAIAAEHLTLP